MGTDSPRRGQRASRALVVLASLAIAFALLAGYVERAGVDSDQFANRATAALSDDSVRALIAERVTDEVILAQQRDLITARPIIEATTSGIVGSRAFTGVFRLAVRDVHRALFARSQGTVTLTLADMGIVLAAALEQVRPSLARQVASTERVELATRDLGTATAKAAGLANDLRWLALIGLVLSVAFVAGALALSGDRRRTVVELGVGVAVAGGLLVAGYAIARSIAVHQVSGPQNQAAAGAVWDAFLGDLRTAAWILAGSGAVIAAAAASLIRPVDLGEPLRQALRLATAEPARPLLRVARGVVLLAAGIFVIAARDAVLTILLTAVGIFLIYEGVSAVLRVIYRPPEVAAAEEPVADEGEDEERELREAEVETPAPGRRRLAAPVLAAVLVVAAVAAFVGTGGTTTAAPAVTTCNGHAELCDRSFDEVALAATHNSMSAPQPGWFSSQQDRPISDQLDDGVRGLLIDTHYADRLADGKLRTDLGDPKTLRRRAKQDGVSPDAVDAALRIRERLRSGKGTRGMYLCHTFCELGALPLAPVLDDIHDFLVVHPDEVVVVVNQDYVTPADLVGAIKEAGLEDFAYRGAVDGTWPTLREMITSNERLVVLAENHAGAAPWYRLAYDGAVHETPFSFSKPSQLTRSSAQAKSCRANRGKPGSPLLLINHWITTDPVPRPSNAAKVNAYAPLVRRLRTCQRVRKQMPNLVAVDFYRTGDVFKAVDAINGLT